MRERHGFLIGFLICVGIISYQDIANCHDLPWPPRLLATGIVFGMLSAFSWINEELASIMAIGITMAFGINTFSSVEDARAKGKIAGGFGYFTPSCTHSCQPTAQPASFQQLYPQGDQVPAGYQPNVTQGPSQQPTTQTPSGPTPYQPPSPTPTPMPPQPTPTPGPPE